jgi:hypothetical protein
MLILAADPKVKRTMVFVETRSAADGMSKHLNKCDLKSTTINGYQGEEEANMCYNPFSIVLLLGIVHKRNEKSHFINSEKVNTTLSLPPMSALVAWTSRIWIL